MQCNLDNYREIQAHTLLDTGVTGIAFVDKKMAHYICKVLQILFIKLAKLKPIKGFDGKPANLITYVIYPILMIQSHTELFVPLLVIKLGQYSIILGKPWMHRHSIILDMSCNKLVF